MCYREYTGWPKSRFTEFTLVLIIVFSVHKIVNLLYPSWCCSVMVGIEGPNGSEGWKDSFVPGLLWWPGRALLQRRRCLPTMQKGLGPRRICFSPSRMAEGSCKFVHSFRETFSLHFLCLNKIGFGLKVCLLTNIRDGSPGPKDNDIFHFKFLWKPSLIVVNKHWAPGMWQAQALDYLV